MQDGFERYNGWLILIHPHMEDQLNRWTNQVTKLSAKPSKNLSSHPKLKLLATLEYLMFEKIPSDPGSQQWLQGNTLGPENRAWRRAKFMGQYRLFFRYDSKSKIIVYAWVNDESTLRAYGSKNDAYLVFERLLASGNPPSNWDDLLDSSNFLGPQQE